VRITIVYRYFWPETFLPNDIAKWLAAAGHDVEVITGQPSYNPESRYPRRPRREEWNGVRIRRVPMFEEKRRGIRRQVNSALFIVIATLMIVFGRRRDVVWTTSIPPVIQPFAMRLASWIRRAKFVYFLQDIYPEIGLSVHMLKDGVLSRLLRSIDTWTLDRSDAVVTLSDDMAAVVRTRGAAPKRLVLINNFAAVTGQPVNRPQRSGPARFVFAGNIGRFQHLEGLIETFASIDPAVAVLDVLGEGRAKAGLQRTAREHGIAAVRFHEGLPVDAAFAFIRECDVGVVSLEPGLFRYAYPSKTFTYVAAGLPLLALVETDSQIARETRARNIGLTVDWGEPASRRIAAIHELAAWPADKRDAVREQSRELFDPEVARAKWLDLFQDLKAA
jgi:glycosyltransferase involved in cell wall biosynthesis